MRIEECGSERQILAYANLKALLLAELDDPDLSNDLTHQQAIEQAKDELREVIDD